VTVYLGELHVSDAADPRQFYLDTAHLCVFFFCSGGETFSEETGYKRKLTKTNSLIHKHLFILHTAEYFNAVYMKILLLTFPGFLQAWYPLGTRISLFWF
jgi:hypothetical protein